LVIKRLSQILGGPKRRGFLIGLCVVVGLFTSHLLCVDGILVFCDGTRRDVISIKDDLALFEVVTDMMINSAKSTLSIYGLKVEDLDFIKVHFPFL